MPFANRVLRWTVLLLLALVPAAPALAAASDWFEYDQGAVRLISAGATSGSADEVVLGLQFRLKPGWKIYWRSPGDAGFPPAINWAGSSNFAGAEMTWPAPRRFSVLDLETLGYKDDVVFPIAAKLFEPGKAVSFKARLRFLTCDDICVPYEVNLALALPSGPDVNTPEGALIEAWQKRVPETGSDQLAIERAEVAGTGSAAALLVSIRSATPFGQPDLFVEGPSDFGFAKPAVQVAASGTEALMRIGIQPPKRPDAKIVGETVILTLVDGARAVEAKVQLAAAATAVPPQDAPMGASFGFLAILGLALAGGFILNLMPCVLPVLSIKLLSVVSHGGETPTRVRRGFLASAAGIVACFMLLGSVAVGLRAAGLAVGWGIQFQQPVFLAFMISILTLFACNMWGLFEIRLPGAVADAAAGAGGAHGGSLAGHFLTGAFATLLATPCTAPFLGTAVGFALSRGAAEIYAVFLALGIGLALPWIAVAAFPVLVNRLPRPGHWMITLKRVLSIALVGTAAWLLSVLWFQIGGPATAMIALLMGAIGFSVWQYRHLGEKARFATWIVVALLTAISMVGAGTLSGGGIERPAARADAVWKPFDRAAIPGEVAAGRTVLVDVTADWCLTCQVNKSLVLDRGQVAQLLTAGRIVAMKADWTRPDPAIADYLRSFGRFGIPFNVVYGPGAPAGIPLPEILTEQTVLDAVARAGKGAPLALRLPASP
jgi:suppressor for copper-sensitivity B